MDSSTQPSRRRVIAGASAGLGVIALAACGGGEEESADPTRSSGGEKSSAPVDEGATLATLSEIEVGSAIRVKSGDKNIIVTRSGDDTAVAFDAKCTHKGCPVKPQGKELRCPCHQSRFDPENGEVLGGPADAPLGSIDVHVKSGKVVTGKG